MKEIVAPILALLCVFGVFVGLSWYENTKAQPARELARERSTNADTCRYIMGYGTSQKDPFHFRRLEAACAHEIMSKGGTADKAVAQCFPTIEACEKGLAK